MPDAPVKRTTMANGAALLALAILVSLVGYSYLSNGLVASLASTTTPADAKLDAILARFESFGTWAPLAYILFVTAEVVVAPLPGLMLYAPGGILFGGFFGGLYALVGNLLGAAIAYHVMRFAGAALFGEQIRGRLRGLEGVLEKRGFWIVFLLRVNPVTSSDLVSYAAGLTPMPLWKLLLGTAAGMAPLCWLQAYLAEGLLEAFPVLLYPVLGACVLYLLLVVWIVRALGRKEQAAEPVSL